jgi:hypothetical protein
LLAIFFVPISQANDDPKRLIQSCQELVDIYAKRDQQHLLAGVTTGLSEALRAGYCMGVTDEYRRHYQCATNDWFKQAERIAKMPASFSSHTSIDELLEMSCEI